MSVTAWRGPGSSVPIDQKYRCFLFSARNGPEIREDTGFHTLAANLMFWFLYVGSSHGYLLEYHPPQHSSPVPYFRLSCAFQRPALYEIYEPWFFLRFIVTLLPSNPTLLSPSTPRVFKIYILGSRWSVPCRDKHKQTWPSFYCLVQK